MVTCWTQQSVDAALSFSEDIILIECLINQEEMDNQAALINSIQNSNPL